MPTRHKKYAHTHPGYILSPFPQFVLSSYKNMGSFIVVVAAVVVVGAIYAEHSTSSLYVAIIAENCYGKLERETCVDFSLFPFFLCMSFLMCSAMDLQGTIRQTQRDMAREAREIKEKRDLFITEVGWLASCRPVGGCVVQKGGQLARDCLWPPCGIVQTFLSPEYFVFQLFCCCCNKKCLAHVFAFNWSNDCCAVFFRLLFI